MGMFARLTDYMDRRSDLMAGMMERLDVDPASFDTLLLGQQLGHAARACAVCKHGEACASWQGTHPAGAAHAPDFCPNGELWDATRNR